ncbi:MAG: hypothetical protein ABJN65_01465 [Parasphingorhabdus sp.]
MQNQTTNSNETESSELPGIDPADMEMAQDIMNFDPVSDVAGPTSVQGNVKIPSSVGITALAPEKQAAIKAELQNVAPHLQEAKEQQLVHKALHENSFVLRVKGGGGSGADPYQAATFEVANEREEANQEALRIVARLAEVDHYKPSTDESTGESTPQAVMAVTGPRREALESELARIQHKINMLDGEEGQRRLKTGLRAAIAERKEREKEARIVKTAAALAEEMDEQERIEKQAAALRSVKRDRPA